MAGRRRSGRISSMNEKVLVVDDENEIADLIELYFQNENFTVYKFYSGLEALKCVDEEKLDLAILDIMLPDYDGLSLCKKIREHHTFPVIMLTAKTTEIDRITGLSIGADDYISKPFSPLELVARVKAQLRRATRYNEQEKASMDIVELSGLMLNKRSHECLLDETPISLTPIEFSLLWILAENRGEVLSPERLFHEVWGEKYFTNNNNTVMVHIRHIREKLNDTSENPRYIKTIWGVGYKIEK